MAVNIDAQNATAGQRQRPRDLPGETGVDRIRPRSAIERLRPGNVRVAVLSGLAIMRPEHADQPARLWVHGQALVPEEQPVRGVMRHRDGRLEGVAAIVGDREDARVLAVAGVAIGLPGLADNRDTAILPAPAARPSARRTGSRVSTSRRLVHVRPSSNESIRKIRFGSVWITLRDLLALMCSQFARWCRE